jgi:hypothetical protein
MPPAFMIRAEWQPGDSGLDEDRHTSAQICIAFGDRIATRVDSDWSGSVHDKINASAYPLASWFASCWWRLRWEPAPDSRPTAAWRSSHETTAAGHGFIWPRLTFEPDDKTVDAVCRPSSNKSQEPVRYISSFRASLAASEFEEGVDAFMALVLERLSAKGATNTDLHRIWNEVLFERADPIIADWRKLEARLGFDPDEAPEQLIERLRDLASESGEAAMTEIAPALPKRDVASSLARTIEFAHSRGVLGSIRVPKALDYTVASIPSDVAPWERGRILARNARRAWNFELEPLSDDELSGLLEVSAEDFDANEGIPHRLPIGLAVRNEDDPRMKFLFRKQNRPGRRFEAVRFIADHLIAPEQDRWLPETDAKTARQKIQRAFAAEFLCPIAALREFLEDDYPNEAIEDAADRFGVSPLMIKSHLANNDLIPIDFVAV